MNWAVRNIYHINCNCATCCKFNGLRFGSNIPCYTCSNFRYFVLTDTESAYRNKSVNVRCKGFFICITFERRLNKLYLKFPTAEYVICWMFYDFYSTALSFILKTYTLGSFYRNNLSGCIDVESIECAVNIIVCRSRRFFKIVATVR